MADAAREAKISVKVVTSADPKGVSQTTTAVKKLGDTTKAADDHAKRLKDTLSKREGNDGYKRYAASQGYNPDGSRVLSQRESFQKKAQETIQKREDDQGFQKYMRGRGLNADGSKMTMVDKGKAALGDLAANPMVMRMAGAAAAAAAAYVIAAKASEQAAKTINTLSNASLTNAQKMEKLAEQFIPLYSSFKSLYDAIKGTTEALRLNQERLENAAVGQKTRSEEFKAKQSVASEVAGYEARGRAADRFQLGPTQTFDRGTVSGAQKTEDEARRAAARDAATNARRDAAVARSSFDEGRNRVAEDDRRIAAATKRRDDLAARLRKLNEDERGGTRRKAEKDEVLKQMGVASSEIGDAEKQKQTDLNTLKERGAQWAEKESQARKANINVMQEELNILRAKEQRMAAAQTALGGLNKGEYEMAKQIAKQVKEGGIENATPEMVEWASKVAPKMIEKMKEKFGAGRAQELANLGIDDYKDDYAGGDTLDQVRAKVDKVQADVKLTINMDTKAMALDLVNLLRPILKDWMKSVEVEMENERRKVREGQQQRNNLQ